jgi:cathepsin A (carboxypeptidase C)
MFLSVWRLHALAALAHAVTSPRSAVTSLPGFGAPPTRHWTGFVEVDHPTSTHLFYYLVESAGDPKTDPLVWWMNGGPGASSFAGLFGENGPLLLNSSGQLTPNPYAWNRHANVLYVEFGPGIGFSYCANSSTAGPQTSASCSPCYTDDDRVAQQNAVLLEALLSNTSLFPEFAARPLYLAGESCTWRRAKPISSLAGRPSSRAARDANEVPS